MTLPLLTAKECLAKAEEMERAARFNPSLREGYLQMAAEWRTMATLAEWQDILDAHLPGAAESRSPGHLRN